MIGLRHVIMFSTLAYLVACGGSGKHNDLGLSNDAAVSLDASGVTCSSAETICNGSCIDLEHDNANCGACGTACDSGNVCNGNGTCALTCITTEVACGGKCIDPLSDNHYCGATTCAGSTTSGTACAAGSICNGAGVCAPTCAAGDVPCSGRCVNPLTDNSYCGATICAEPTTSGTACAAGSICNGAGQCALTCVASQLACGGECIDPMTDRSYCGATSCSSDDAGTSGITCASGDLCTNGHCAPTCAAGQLACGGKCIDPMTDRSYCGATSCGSDADGGAEVDGGTGTTCQAGYVCNAGTCALLCGAGLISCGGACIVPTAGNQTFTFTGTVQTLSLPCQPFHIVASGAQGGTGGGLGASMSGDFFTGTTETVSIVVGEQGHAQVGGSVANSSGGGGGSFVYSGSTLYIAAGGGGGKCVDAGSVQASAAGQTGTSGGASSDGNPGGTNGAPGPNGFTIGRFDSGGGTGWLMSATAPLGGSNYANGWVGGAGFCGGGGGGCGGVGGFGGGGGGGNDYGGGGGGGGYSGGAGGDDPNHGGGGGSFNSSTNQSNNAGVQSGNGQVTISW